MKTLLAIVLISAGIACKSSKQTVIIPREDSTPITPIGDGFLTTADGSRLLTPFSAKVNASSDFSSIQVDPTQTFQTIDGFGYTLTGGSVELINTLSATKKTALLNDIFSKDGIGVSYIRISVAASDLDGTVYTYSDLPAGQTDPEMKLFDLGPKGRELVAMLQEILIINPDLKIMASPWTAPLWMKSNNNSKGGILLPKYHDAYAKYLVKYLQTMQDNGIHIDALTIQNEPEHGGNNPSMLMTPEQQAAFIKEALGPQMKIAGIDTKIIIWDHNCDKPSYPITVLNDADAAQYITGSAFHLYAGDISALSAVKSAHPSKKLYFTEQWTGSNGDFAGDLMWHVKNVVIGSMRNHSQTALEWNLANDPTFGPHTPGGCTQCKGAVTITADSYTKNVSYYIIAQASKLIPPGSTRIYSNESGGVANVAFRLPNGQIGLVLLNENQTTKTVKISLPTQEVFLQLPARSVYSEVF